MAPSMSQESFTEVGYTALDGITTNITMMTAAIRSDKEQDLTVYVIVLFVVFLPLSLFIIVGNALVIIAVHTSFHLRQRAIYRVVASMAVTDLIVGISVIPIYYMAIFVDDIKREFYGCMWMLAVILTPCSSSMLHVLIVAADRYIAVFFSLRYADIVTSRRISLILGAIWVIVVVVNSLPFIGWNRRNRQVPLNYCYTDQVFSPSFLTFQFTLTFIIPICVMCFIYYRIIVAARGQARRVGAHDFRVDEYYLERNGLPSISRNCASAPTDGSEPISLPVVHRRRGPSVAELKATKTSAIVLGAFLVCWFPSYGIHLAFTFVNNGRSEPLHNEVVGMIHMLSNLLPFISSSANPVIYAFRYEDFRKSFKRTLHCRLWRSG